MSETSTSKRNLHKKTKMKETLETFQMKSGNLKNIKFKLITDTNNFNKKSAFEFTYYSFLIIV